jgi:poly-gamma-glutamate synthesis protein (capsule biosynthesis protein)
LNATKDDTVTLCAVGDVALCDGIVDRMQEHGYEYPLSAIRHVLADNDLSIANLENVFTRSDAGLKAQAHLLKCDASNAEALRSAGFDAVSIANNHIMDFGVDGLRETVSILRDRGIQCCGAGETLAQARSPVILEAKGIRFGFLAYAMKGVQSAVDDRAGAAWIDFEMIAEDMQKLSKSVDHIVVALHAGLEFIDYPHPNHREICLKVAKQGASLIVGHHPHVIHGIERVNGCVIAYSLGNLVFDTRLMDYQTERSQEALILRCTFDKQNLLDFQVNPTVINDELQTELAVDDREKKILQRLEEISSAMNTDAYPGIYFEQASRIWPKINIAVNLKIIRQQGLLAFMKRMPRLKWIYVVLLAKYVARRALGLFRKRRRTESA